jgi:polysaccharide biosynthesis protein PslH
VDWVCLMRILFVSPFIGWPLKEGGHIRLWNTLQALKPLGAVDVVVFGPSQAENAQTVFDGCERVFHRSSRWLQFTRSQSVAYDHTLGRLRLVLGTSRPFRYLGPDHTRLAEWFRNLVAAGQYDVIWIAKAVTAVALRWKDPVRTILDADNFDYVLSYQLLRSSEWYGAKVLNYVDVLKMAWWEGQLPRWFARVVRCSEADRQRTPSRNVVVVPNGACLPPMAERSPGKRLLFVGTLGYGPNRAGLEWFLKRIWPLIRRSVPEAEIDVVGANASPWLRSRHGRDGVLVHGFVEELGPLWRRAACSVVPLQAGSGTRLKILESLSQRVPVVSTTVGAYGLEIDAEHGLLRVNEPALFAAECTRLLLDSGSARTLGERGREVVALCYDWERIHDSIRNLVREAACAHDTAAGRRCSGRKGRIAEPQECSTGPIPGGPA